MQSNPIGDPNAALRERLVGLSDAQLVATLLEALERARDLARGTDPPADEALTTASIVIRTTLERVVPEALVLGTAIHDGTLRWSPAPSSS